MIFNEKSLFTSPPPISESNYGMFKIISSLPMTFSLSNQIGDRICEGNTGEQGLMSPELDTATCGIDRRSNKGVIQTPPFATPDCC